MELTSTTLTLPQVMTWASYLPYTIVGSGDTYTATLNLATGVVSELTVSNTRHDMFCPGARAARRIRTVCRQT